MSLIGCIDSGACYECDHDPTECMSAGRCYYEMLQEQREKNNAR